MELKQVTSFLKSVNLSLFKGLFKIEFNVLMTQASKIFLSNENVCAKRIKKTIQAHDYHSHLDV